MDFDPDLNVKVHTQARTHSGTHKLTALYEEGFVYNSKIPAKLESHTYVKMTIIDEKLRMYLMQYVLNALQRT